MQFACDVVVHCWDLDIMVCRVDSAGVQLTFVLKKLPYLMAPKRFRDVLRADLMQQSVWYGFRWHCVLLVFISTSCV